jgi:uncharacterized membrane protein
MLMAIPLLVVPILFYLAVALIGGPTALDATLFAARLPSGGAFAFTNGLAIITVAMIALLVEVMKSTNVKNTNSIVDHGLSTALLVLAILLFVLMPSAATGTFFVLILICALDVIAGFTVSIKTAQRDFQVDRTFS